MLNTINPAHISFYNSFLKWLDEKLRNAGGETFITKSEIVGEGKERKG